MHENRVPAADTIDSLPRGGPTASWLDRQFETERLEFLDRDDVDDRVKRSVVRSLDHISAKLRYNEKFAQLALQQVADIPHPKILELGAGHGGLSRALLEQHPDAELTVTDINAASVDDMVASDLGSQPRAVVRVEDATSINAPDQAYDLVVFAQSFHHLPPRAASATIAEATRVAKKFLVIDLLRRPSIVQPLRLPLFFALIALAQGYPTAHDWLISELRAYSPSALSALASQAGADITTQFSKDRVHQVAVMSRVAHAIQSGK
ncbi:class I SAM-dependent methyltransferase [Nocardia testacea]|uniref:Class I SAM-dependent methyltransferase n=1 Tax=Nocardia testacea TaxID=248551 RepID=A0ABW7VRG2_9NOCA